MLLSELMPVTELLDEEDFPLFEMANLGCDDTGINMGIIFISTKIESHGCRIKFMLRADDQSNMLSLSIPDYIIGVDKLGTRLSDTVRKEVMRFAIKNHDKILYFWNNGTSLNRHALADFLNSFEPLTDAEKKASRKLELKFKKGVR